MQNSWMEKKKFVLAGRERGVGAHEVGDPSGGEGEEPIACPNQAAP